MLSKFYFLEFIIALSPNKQLCFYSGDPLYDLIPIYLDIFRGDMTLLKHLLDSYRLPLVRERTDYVVSSEPVEKWKKFKRISYRAM